MKLLRSFSALVLLAVTLTSLVGCANNSAFMEASGWDTSNYNPSTPVTANVNPGWTSAGYASTGR